MRSLFPILAAIMSIASTADAQLFQRRFVPGCSDDFCQVPQPVHTSKMKVGDKVQVVSKGSPYNGQVGHIHRLNAAVPGYGDGSVIIPAFTGHQVILLDGRALIVEEKKLVKVESKIKHPVYDPATDKGKIVYPVFDSPPTYQEARTIAKTNNVPILIFVGVKSRYVDGFVRCEAGTIPGYPSKCIVVGDAKLNWITTLSHVATDSDFREAVKLVVSADALDEVNRLRAERRLHPYQRDEGLTRAAIAAAMFRAEHGIRGHTRNDFGFLPSGSDASAAGCGALEPFWGFGACCVYERQWTYAGAATVAGKDGRLYHHLFVK